MPPDSLNLKGVKALVVEQDATVRVALKKRLVDWGAEVTEESFGARGVAELTRARDEGRAYQLVFVAAAMSPVNGFEVIQSLRAHPDEFAHTVLLLSAERIVDDVAQMQSLGLTAYVAKPLSRSAIVGAVSSVLGIAPQSEGAGSELRFKRARILLAEDTPDVAWIIRTQVEGPDYQVDVASDGAVAANLFRLVDYDLILMDIQMPNFDGYWATREIRAWERQNQMKRTPIIAITAFAHQEDAQKSLRAGLDGYLVKPVEKDKLLAVIGRYLKKK